MSRTRASRRRRPRTCPARRLFTRPGRARPATIAHSLEDLMRMSRLTMLIGAAISLTVSLPAAQHPATSSTAPGAAPAASNPRTDQYKRNVGMEVDAMGENIQKMNDMVFSFAELGFQEYETTKYLTGILEQSGFKIERGVAGIPTAWTARWGSGKPVIALGSDVDCIPQASQKPGVA